jgi:hypothetical protein
MKDMHDTEQSNLPAFKLRLPDIVAEYDQKLAAIPETVEAFKQAVTDTESCATIRGTYAGCIWYRASPSADESRMKANLLESAWKHVYHGLNLDKIAPASDRSRFEMAMKNPAPFTLDNIGATFGKYIEDPRAHILRGLAECFSQLDPAFKSHDKMKIGVKGLPKRIILTSVTGYGGYGTDRLKDTLNALRVLDGLPHIEWPTKHNDNGEVISYGLRDILENAKREPFTFDGLTLKRFANGNGHLFFSPEVLKNVNNALAEYYGEVLPDCPEATPKKRTGTAVSKDLQFYPTPQAAADALVQKAGLRDGDSILEPSCGDGAILDAVRRYCDTETYYCPEERRQKNPSVSGLGIEVDPTRAAMAEAKGYSVMCRNFLEVTPNPKFDVVLMNPPFYGKHYQKHVEHARKFLKPGGRLYAILPVTAATDHGFVVVPKYGRDVWQDLPVGSFSESGTNINTGIATFFAPDNA